MVCVLPLFRAKQRMRTASLCSHPGRVATVECACRCRGLAGMERVSVTVSRETENERCVVVLAPGADLNRRVRPSLSRARGVWSVCLSLFRAKQRMGAASLCSHPGRVATGECTSRCPGLAGMVHVSVTVSRETVNERCVALLAPGPGLHRRVGVPLSRARGYGTFVCHCFARNSDRQELRSAREGRLPGCYLAFACLLRSSPISSSSSNDACRACRIVACKALCGAARR